MPRSSLRSVSRPVQDEQHHRLHRVRVGGEAGQELPIVVVEHPRASLAGPGGPDPLLGEHSVHQPRGARVGPVNDLENDVALGGELAAAGAVLLAVTGESPAA